MIAIVRPVASAVAVAAFPVVEPDDPLTLPVTLPVSAAEIVPALKLPDASRATIADAVFRLVAVVAEFETLDALEIVASFVSTIAALALMSALTMLVARLSLEYAMAALKFKQLAGRRQTLACGLAAIQAYERTLSQQLIEGLQRIRGVQIGRAHV